MLIHVFTAHSFTAPPCKALALYKGTELLDLSAEEAVFNRLCKQDALTNEANQANPVLKFIFSWACRFDSDLSLGAELTVRALDRFLILFFCFLMSHLVLDHYFYFALCAMHLTKVYLPQYPSGHF